MRTGISLDFASGYEANAEVVAKAQAAQLSDRFVIVTGRPVFSLASMSRTSSLAVRLGVVRTRIVRIENKADPRLRQDISTGP